MQCYILRECLVSSTILTMTVLKNNCTTVQQERLRIIIYQFSLPEVHISFYLLELPVPISLNFLLLLFVRVQLPKSKHNESMVLSCSFERNNIKVQMTHRWIKTKLCTVWVINPTVINNKPNYCVGWTQHLF